MDKIKKFCYRYDVDEKIKLLIDEDIIHHKYSFSDLSRMFKCDTRTIKRRLSNNQISLILKYGRKLTKLSKKLMCRAGIKMTNLQKIKIKSIKKVGKHETIDFSLYPHEIYLLNDIISHNCHSPELWDDSIGEELTKDKYNGLKKNIEGKIDMIDNFMIFGGEPLEKPKEEIIEFLTFLKQFNKPIWLFTRFELKQVDKEILDLLDYIKCGMYLEKQATDDNIIKGIKLASKNQHIFRKKEGKWYKENE